MNNGIEIKKRTIINTVDNIQEPIKEITEKPSEDGKKRLPTKFYLPVLNLNQKDKWESLEKKDRKHLTPELAEDVCTNNCCGYEGLAAGCCQLDPENLEHVLGAITKEDISRILKHFRKINPSIERSDIVIDQEEGELIGRTFFNDHPVFKSESSYPMLRIQIYENRFICKFLNPKTKRCGIYSVRPDMCSGYYCAYVKSKFLIKTPNQPNIYKKIY